MSKTASSLRYLRTKMDTTVQVFIETWFDFPKERRGELPFSLDNDGGDTPARWIKDEHCYVVAELQLVDGTYRVVWMVSTEVLRDLDACIDWMKQESTSTDLIEYTKENM